MSATYTTSNGRVSRKRSSDWPKVTRSSDTEPGIVIETHRVTLRDRKAQREQLRNDRPWYLLIALFVVVGLMTFRPWEMM